MRYFNHGYAVKIPHILGLSLLEKPIRLD